LTRKGLELKESCELCLYLRSTIYALMRLDIAYDSYDGDKKVYLKFTFETW